MPIIFNQSIHGKFSYIQYFSKVVYVTLQVFELHVSDCAHILLLALMGLNNDEAIYKFIFGISIYGAAWSYNNVKQLQIWMYKSYRLVYPLHYQSLHFLPHYHKYSYISLQPTVSSSLMSLPTVPYYSHISHCFFFCVWSV